MAVVLGRKPGGSGGGGAPSGPAGGALGGTYPNPSFAVDMATQAELDAVAAYAPPSYAYYRDQQAQNTAGGTFTQGAWRTRVLNTEVNDDDGIGTLAANRVTLLAGTYICQARAPFCAVNFNVMRLQNVTDGTTVLTGATAFDAKDAGSAVNQSDATLRGQFTIAASKELELQHQCSETTNTIGLGAAANFTIEIYAEIEFWKVG